MSNLFQKLRGPFGASLLISAMLHLSIAALLLVNWDFDKHKPELEETVSVEIVPPPEEEEQPTKEEEAPAAEEEQPEELEQAKPEQAEPPPAEETAQEEPPASVEPPPETEATPPPLQETSEELASAQQLQIQPFKPVFEFGDEAQETEGTPEGNSARAEPDLEEPPGLAEEETPPPEADAPSEQGTEPSPEDPQAFPDPNLSPFVEEPTEEETPEVVEDPQEQEVDEPELTPARTLYSEESGRARNAIAAMASLPRGVRGGQLCTTELREQLRHSTPAYDPDMLPAYRFPDGNAMIIRKAAFRAKGRWFNVAFNCQINKEGTRIIGFSHTVGAEIPREQWAERNLPEF